MLFPGSWLPQSTGIAGKKFEKFDIPTIMKRMNPIRSDSKRESVEKTTYVEVEEQHQKSNVLQRGTGMTYLWYMISVMSIIN